MMAAMNARKFAQDWCDQWNSHDLDAILSHYSDNVILISPTAAKLLRDTSGTVRGKDALRNYFGVGLQAYPNLRFEVLDVTSGVSSIVIYYANQNGAKVSEFMEFDPAGMVSKVIAHYSNLIS
jgi:hypothetical protein